VKNVESNDILFAGSQDYTTKVVALFSESVENALAMLQALAEKSAESDAAWWGDGAVLALDIFNCLVANMVLNKESTKLLARLIKITTKNVGPKGSGPAWFYLERTTHHIIALHSSAPAHSERAEMLSKLRTKVEGLVSSAASASATTTVAEG